MPFQRYKLFPLTEKGSFVTIINGEYMIYRMERLRFENCQVPVTSLREIDILSNLQHTNITQLLQFIGLEQYWAVCPVYLFYEHIEWNLYDYLDLKHLTIKATRFVFQQIMNGLKYLHDNSIIHRNLKPQNIFVTNNGIVKIAKFGYVEENLFERLHRSILSYRAPEVLLGDIFREPVDLWSAGCILFELFKRRPLFNGINVASQLKQIYEAVGTPVNYYFAHNFPMKHTFKSWKGPPLNLECPDAEHLALQLLKFDGNKRLNVDETLNHRFFEKHNIDSELIK